MGPHNTHHRENTIICSSDHRSGYQAREEGIMYKFNSIDDVLRLSKGKDCDMANVDTLSGLYFLKT